VSEPDEFEDVDRDDLAERPADVEDPLSDPLPVEADEADVVEQTRDLPDSSEDEYPD
jgi:hypothetical protein